MFNGYRVINKRYIYLYLDNNYEFANDINTREKKKMDILNSCSNYLKNHNLDLIDKVYLVSNGVVLGYINKDTLDKYK